MTSAPASINISATGEPVYDLICQLHHDGRHVIPTGGGGDGKKPVIPHWVEYQKRQPTSAELHAWQEKYHPTVWAVVCGSKSDVIVIDADNEDRLSELEALGLKPHVLTPKGGHFYIKHPGYHVKPLVNVIPGIDIRGDGSYANVVGTRKDNGKYTVLIPPINGTLYKVTDLPEYLQDALQNGSKPKRRSAKAIATKITQGQRNASLVSLAGSMRRYGASKDAILVALQQINNTQCDPPLGGKEVQDIAESISRYEPGGPNGVLPDTGTTSSDAYHLTDIGNAKRFADQHRGKVRYSHEMKKWLIFLEGRWQEDRIGHVRSLAKTTVLGWYLDVSAEQDDGRRKQLRAHAVDSEKEQRITAMLSLAQSEPGIPVTLDQMDTDPYLFNCSNCTIDLRTGQVRPHDPNDLLMQISPVEFDISATCDEWLRFLNIVTDGDNELMSFLKRAVGMSLTADTKTQAFFFLHGKGNNGKSTFLSVGRKLLGSYGLKADMSLFMIKDRGDSSHNESLANLRGKRFIIASELEEGKRLATAIIKDLTGGEHVRASRKYEHEVEFQPTGKLWVSGNHQPVITDTTLSIWRRLNLVPFIVTIKNAEENYIDKLEAELSGILNWAIEGCLEWQKQGLGQAEAIRMATEKYRIDQDVIAEFLTENCILDPQTTVLQKILFEIYQSWAVDNADKVLGKQKFGDRLVEKGVISFTGHSNKRFWRGIRLLTDEEKVNMVNFNPQNPEAFPHTRALEESSGKLPEIVNQINPHGNLPPYPSPCHSCGADKYWLTPWGEYRCCRCHPQQWEGNE